jgi:hypothetical protein
MDRSRRLESEIYFNDQYFYALFSNKNIDIYSTKFVNLVQILDVSDQDIVSMRSSFIRPGLFVLARNALLVYSPYYSIYGTISFSRIFKEPLSTPAAAIEVSVSGEYLVLTNDAECRVMRVGWGGGSVEEPQSISSMSKVANFKFGEAIKKSNLSNGKSAC